MPHVPAIAAARDIAEPMRLVVGRNSVEVESLADASAKFALVRNSSGRGSRSMPSAAIYQGETMIARISYNGRVWSLDQSELLFEPNAELPLIKGEALPSYAYLAPSYRRVNEEEFAAYIAINTRYGGQGYTLADAMPSNLQGMRFVAGSLGSEPNHTDHIYINAQGRLDAFTGNSHGGRFVLAYS